MKKLNTEKLPSSWCVKCDGSDRFKEVMSSLDADQADCESWYKDKRFYYGQKNDSHSVKVRMRPFGTVLTLDELCELVEWEDGKDTDVPTNINPRDWVSDEEIEGKLNEWGYGGLDYGAGAEWMRQRMAEEFEKRMK